MTELRPTASSGWRRDRRAERRVHAAIGEQASVWRRGGLTMVSALAVAEYPDGTGEIGPQWHVSISAAGGGHPSDDAARKALACLGLAALYDGRTVLPHAEEDNHEPGIARHFWVPVDPARRVDCECKTTERVIVGPDGHRWTTPTDPAKCHGCDYEVLVDELGIPRPCPIHGVAP